MALPLFNFAAAPSTQPADSDVSDIFSHATTAPATQPVEPTSRPASPFVNRPNGESRPATLTLSNGETITGRLSHTPGKPLRVWVEADQSYHDIPFSLIRQIDAKVLWERQEKEWHFKESGSDIKEYSGKTYPARETQYTFTLVNGQSVTGGAAEPLYLQTADGPVLFPLLKRDKGRVGQSLDQLVYVKRVQFK